MKGQGYALGQKIILPCLVTEQAGHATKKVKPRVLGHILLACLLSAAACRTADVLPPAPPGQQDADGADGKQGPTIDALGPVGSAARQILQPEPFTEIVIEIAFVEGREPSPDTTAHLEEEIERASQKPVSVDTHEIQGGKGSYTSADIRGLSESSRTESAPRASIFLAFLDGGFAENDQALGVAVAATVAAVFPDRIGSLSTLLQPGGVERAVAVHEVGHILALVNIGYESASDREDPEHPSHSSNKSSVMYWAVETLSVADVFAGGPPDRFDEADIADLRMLAGDS